MLEARGDRLRLLGRVRVEQSFRGRAGQVIVEDSPDHVRLRVRLLGLDAGHGGARGAADVRGLRGEVGEVLRRPRRDRKSTRLNSSHVRISYAVFCLKKKKTNRPNWFRSGM